MPGYRKAVAILMLAVTAWYSEARAGDAPTYSISIVPQFDLRRIEAVVEHGVVHPGKTASALLHDPERRQRLRDERIAGAWPVAAFAELGQGQRRRRIAGAGNLHPVAEHPHEDFA